MKKGRTTKANKRKAGEYIAGLNEDEKVIESNRLVIKKLEDNHCQRSKRRVEQRAKAAKNSATEVWADKT